MFVVLLCGRGEEEQVSSAWDFPTREKAEEFVSLFNEQCSLLRPGVDFSEHYSLRVAEVFDEAASSLEEMFAIWQSKAEPAWLGVVADHPVEAPSRTEIAPLAAESESVYDSLIASLEDRR